MTSFAFTTSEYKSNPSESQAVLKDFTVRDRDEGAISDRGLSYDKQKFITFYSPTLKKFMYIEVYKVRYTRMRRSVVEWAHLSNVAYSGDKYRRVMITLTYEKVDGWLPNDINRYVRDLKKKLGERFVTYAWVAELQERGAIHYHLIAVVRKGTKIPLPDKSRMWTHGSSSISTARSVYYLVTYLKKKYQKNFSEFPKGARCFGIGVFELMERNNLRFLRLKPWEQEFLQHNKMNYYFLRDERENRKKENNWRFYNTCVTYGFLEFTYQSLKDQGLIEGIEGKDESKLSRVDLVGPSPGQLAEPLTAGP